MTSESSRPGAPLGERLQALGRRLGEREAGHRQDLDEARAFAEKLRADVEAALERFHQAAAEAGAPHLRARLGEIHADDKHLRSVEFDVSRGRHRAIVTVKSRGQVTFVGPFRSGKTEGPCRSFPLDAAREIEDTLGLFLEEFLEQAATP
jgi:hypothetical protein